MHHCISPKETLVFSQNAEAHQQVCAGGGALWTFLSDAQKQAKAHANCGIASMQLLAKDKSCN